LARHQQLHALGLAAEPADMTGAATRGDHDHLDARVEHARVDVERSAARVDDLAGHSRQPVHHPETLETSSQVAGRIAQGTDEVRLIAESLPPYGDHARIRREIAHELHGGAPPRSLRIAARHCADRIVMRPAALPGDDAVQGSDEV